MLSEDKGFITIKMKDAYSFKQNYDSKVQRKDMNN